MQNIAKNEITRKVARKDANIIYRTMELHCRDETAEVIFKSGKIVFRSQINIPLSF